jgi:hypothetical protein
VESWHSTAVKLPGSNPVGARSKGLKPSLKTAGAFPFFGVGIPVEGLNPREASRRFAEELAAATRHLCDVIVSVDVVRAPRVWETDGHNLLGRHAT